MSEPVLSLLISVGVVAVAVLFFWPVRGWFWRWLQSFRANERVLIEDALKHVHDCEYRQMPCTLQSLSGALSISGNRAAHLLERLEEMKLVALSDRAYHLTPEGRSYALRVVRIHRLLESYFSDRTNIAADEWHEKAEYREHRTTAEQSESLAAQMGHPRFDPHGDPIPTSRGDLPPMRGTLLTDCAVGRLAEIVHIEDEPAAVHAQLVAENLHPGMRVRVIESTPARIRFEADAEEYILAPVVAANISVMMLPEQQEMTGPFGRLSTLGPGDKARVVGISPSCRGPERRRLLDLGVIPGTVVEYEMSSPSGDPAAYRVRGAVIALRREQADLIQVAEAENGSPLETVNGNGDHR